MQLHVFFFFLQCEEFLQSPAKVFIPFELVTATNFSVFCEGLAGLSQDMRE